MEFQEMHTLVKNIKPDTEGYVNICEVAKAVYGPRTKIIISQLDYDDNIFINLRVKGSIHDRKQWKINKHDALELILRIKDLMVRNEARITETGSLKVVAP
jgi:hypothetical protein